MPFCFGDSASGGLERIHFLLKETWTLLLLVEAGNGPFSSILSLTLNSEFDNFSDHYKKVVIGVLHYSPQRVDVDQLHCTFFHQWSLRSVGG